MLTGLWASFYKEFLVVFRDRGGLAMLFLMPISLVVIMALIMDAPFRNFQESGIELALVNEDNDSLGFSIEKGLKSSEIFSIVTQVNGQKLTSIRLKELVEEGQFKIGIIIPDGATELLNNKIDHLVSGTLAKIGVSEEKSKEITAHNLKIQVLLDPATKKSFRSTVTSSLHAFTSEIESKMLIDGFFTQLMGEEENETSSEINRQFIEFEEVYLSKNGEEFEAFTTNSVQHNVPAWTIFAMFFIVIPLAGNMIKEKDGGSILRIKIAPVPYIVLLIGKLLLYVFVGMIQFILMLLIGIYFLPFLGLPMLQIGHNIFSIFLVAFATSIAATSLGLLIGTTFHTHQQATTFSSVIIVIMAAIGGIWVPLFAMPKTMQIIGSISPLNWALEAFNDLFLRNGNLEDVISSIGLLLLFALISVSITYLYNTKTKV